MPPLTRNLKIEVNMCGCAERRVALVEAAKAVTAGDRAKALASLKFVAASAATDARAALVKARGRLAR